MLDAVVICVFAIVYHRAGVMERAPALLWAALSVLVSMAALYLLGWGYWGVFGGNALLFAGITLFRTLRAP